jgi:hypothetical protein
MTRLARRASLSSRFSLLTSAATAYAECAWVLWEKITYPAQAEWQPLGTAESRGKCSEMGRDYARLRHEKVGRGQVSALAAYECFPDTVDPRGPKPR